MQLEAMDNAFNVLSSAQTEEITGKDKKKNVLWSKWINIIIVFYWGVVLTRQLVVLLKY